MIAKFKTRSSQSQNSKPPSNLSKTCCRSRQLVQWTQHALARVGGMGCEKLVDLPVILQMLHRGGDCHATPLCSRERGSCESRARVHNVDPGMQGLLGAQVQNVDGGRVAPGHADHAVVLGECAGEVCKGRKDDHQKSVGPDVKEGDVRHCVAMLDGACLVGANTLAVTSLRSTLMTLSAPKPRFWDAAPAATKTARKAAKTQMFEGGPSCMPPQGRPPFQRWAG